MPVCMVRVLIFHWVEIPESNVLFKLGYIRYQSRPNGVPELDNLVRS